MSRKKEKRQGIAHLGHLQNWNLRFQWKPVIWEARDFPRGFSSIPSKEIKSLDAFGINYLVVAKDFCWHYGVLSPCGFYFAHHFLSFVLWCGWLAPWFWESHYQRDECTYSFLTCIKTQISKTRNHKKIHKLNLSEGLLFPMLNCFVM